MYVIIACLEGLFFVTLSLIGRFAPITLSFVPNRT